MDSITQCSAHCLVQGRTNSTSTVMCRRLASSTRLCNSHLKTFSVRNANYNKRIHTLLLDSKGIARLLNLHNVCSTLDKHGGFETAIVSPTTGSVCGAVCWKGGSGTLEHISDKKRGTDKVKLSFSTFRLDGAQNCRGCCSMTKRHQKLLWLRQPLHMLLRGRAEPGIPWA
jgi:hypothetical protein